jgi:hypothetical protein
MRITIATALVAVSLIALGGCKQAATSGNEAAANSAAASTDSISGTWKADAASVKFDQKPDEILVQNGQYSCKSCVPQITLAADGAFHPVTAPYSDEMSVKVVDDHNIVRASKKSGRQTGETKFSVSADGNTLTGSFVDTSVPNAPAGKGTFTEARVGPAPAGAHAVSGQWKPTKLADFNDAALTSTYKIDGDTLHMSSLSGTSYDAKLDGSDTPIKGDLAGTTASVKKTGDNSFEETDKRGGKVVGVFTFTANGNTAAATYENKEDGSKVTYTANKQ